jgi:integrase
MVISGIDKCEPRYWNSQTTEAKENEGRTVKKAPNPKNYNTPKQTVANARAREITKSMSSAITVITDIFENYTRKHGSYPTNLKEFQETCRRAIFGLPDPSVKSDTPLKNTDFLAYLEKFKNDIISGKRTISSGLRKGQPYSVNTYKQYGSLYNILKVYIEESKISVLNFDDINLDFYVSFREYFVVKGDKSPGYFGKLIKCIKTIMNDSAEYSLHNNNKHKSRNFIKESSQTDSIFLDNEKLDILFNLDLDDKPRLDKARDLFLIGAYSGLRFSDFSTIKPDDIQGDYIRIKTIKTGKRVTIPILSNLRSILNKYSNKLPDPISNQKLNDALKDLGKEAGFNEVLQIKKFRFGKECIVNIEFYNLITTHTARRSFATNMFKMGIPSILIMAITGHSTEASFLKYIRMNNDDKAVMMMDLLRRSELKVMAGGAA